MTETRDGATDAVLPTLQEVSRVMLDLGAPVTPPRPTAPTAAEMREALADRARLSRGDLDRIDDLMAAVRAEALELAAKRAESRGLCNCSPGYIAGQIRALVSK